MKRVSAYAAKAHLGQLVRDAEAGQSYLITRRGKPVARLGPFESSKEGDPKALAAEVRAFREKLRKRGGRVNVRALIAEGRKR